MAMIAHRISAVLLLLMAQGCISVPLPPREAQNVRQKIGTTVPAFIVPGATTEADVVDALGEPDGASEHRLQFTYTRETRVGGWWTMGPPGMEGTVEHMKYDRLTIVFDDLHIVSSARHEQISCQIQLGRGRGPCADVEGGDLLAAQLPAEVGAEAFPRAMWYRGVRLEGPGNYPGRGLKGTLVIGASTLVFYASNADRKSKPLWELPYTEVGSVTALKWLFTAPAVVVRRANGKYESFVIYLEGTYIPDTNANERAGNLAQKHWRAATNK